MVKRLLSATASEVAKMTKDELKQSIKASEGRIILSENVVLHPPLEHNITYSEFARAYGADMILLNGFDTANPVVLGMYNENAASEINSSGKEHLIRDLKKLVGLPIGLNLEPVDPNAQMAEDRTEIAEGRQATKESFERANQLGFDFICLTGNPGVGVSNEAIIGSIAAAKTHFDGLIIAGKMHGAGVNEPVVDQQTVEKIVSAGADILLVPAIGTVPGISEVVLADAIGYAHQHDVLVMSAIGTSQESADPETIREIALRNKILGVDIQHIGDANMGIYGIENIEVLSNTIRGKRHTAARFARSINR
ncbi:MAG TPA: PEP phosphonomutase [Enterococcus sp.]|nr:PEP phosphonomutase [Enterococcus sp.]